MKNERNLKSGNSLKKIKKNIKAEKKVQKKKLTPAQKKKYGKITAITAASLAVLAILSLAMFNIFADEGTFMRGRKVKKSADLSIDGAMFTYIFWDNFQSSMNGNYASYYKLQGVTSPEDLDKENPHEEGKTWRDHFVEMAMESTNIILSYAQYAIDNGKSLTAEDEKLINDEIKNMTDAATLYGLTLEKYITKNYGRGVKPSDLRHVLELMCLSNIGVDLMEANLEPTTEEINSFRDTNTNELKKADYYFFVLGISGKDNLSAEQQKYFSEKAEEISRSSSETEFKEKVTAYLKDYNASLEAGDKNKVSDKDLEEYIKNELESMKFMNDVYNDEKDIDKWIFSDSRVAGDTYINHQDGYGTYGVAYIIKPVYIDSEWEKLASDKIFAAKAEALLNDLNEKYPCDLLKLAKSISDLKG